MKKVIALFVLSFLLSTLVSAETPQHYNYSTSGVGNNTLPLGTSAGSLVQWLIRPGELRYPTLAKTGKITNIYFLLIAILGPYDYSRVSILLGQTSLTSLPAGAFVTEHMDTVYHRDSITIHSNVVNTHWYKFALDNQFIYDSTKSLVIQLEHYGHSAGTASYIHAHTFLTDKRRNYCTIPPFLFSGQDAYVVHCGIDVTPFTGVESNQNSRVPKEFNLNQNYPNPFNPETVISFDLPKSGFVSLKVYNILGEEVATLLNETKTAGSYNVNFDGSSFSSGMYYYTLESNGFASTKKMLLVK
ncbi:MAG: T9SS type A sorting domain-containing protein [Ignavibacteria bacterium]|jgi:hypothetical protein